MQNGDFEQYYHCPTGPSQIDSAKFWIQPTIGTPDYLNQCASIASGMNIPNTWIGFQQAHSGVGMAGIFIYYYVPLHMTYREYIEDSLGSALISNLCYHFEMYINLSDNCLYSSHNISVYFSDTLITDFSIDHNLPFTPQINNTSGNIPDTLNWTLVSGNYTALGGERYLTIGNFNDDASTDTITVNTTGDNVSYIYIDDVSLIPCTELGITTYTNTLEVNVFPNPVTAALTINSNTTEKMEVTLYDVTSRKLMQQRFVNTTTLNTEGLAKGVYLYEIRNKNGLIKEGKVVKE